MSKMTASIELLNAVRLRCYALLGVESLARTNALTETKWIRATLQALIAPLDRHQIRTVVTVASNILGATRASSLINELRSEESIFAGLSDPAELPLDDGTHILP